MIKKLKLKSEFAQNILVLLTGTTIAQAIPIAVTPILTRLYTPEEFGVFALFLSIVTIAALIATGRYEVAIMLPERDENSKQVLILAVVISCVFSLFLLGVVLLFSEQIELVFGIEGVGDWIYIVPFGIFIMSIYNSLNYWMSRNREFRLVSLNRVLQSSSVSSIQIFFGLVLKLKVGLIISDVIGRLISLLYLLRHLYKKDKFTFRKKRAVVLASKYKKFPVYELPASTLNSAALQSPFFIIPIIFGTVTSGLYFLVFRVVMMPVSLLGSAFLEVFRSHATEDMRKYGTCTKIFKKTLRMLFLLGIPPTVILMVWGPELFAFVFGEQWGVAGVYAQILAPMAFVRLMSSPLSYMFFLKEKLKLNLVFQGAYLSLILLSIFVGMYYESAMVMFYVMSASGVFFYSIQILASYRLSLPCNHNNVGCTL
jgi:O-antigen/teichoic acid export membrane protein